MEAVSLVKYKCVCYHRFSGEYICNIIKFIALKARHSKRYKKAELALNSLSNPRLHKYAFNFYDFINNNFRGEVIPLLSMLQKLPVSTVL